MDDLRREVTPQLRMYAGLLLALVGMLPYLCRPKRKG
jgi:hypothetical protein